MEYFRSNLPQGDQYHGVLIRRCTKRHGSAHCVHLFLLPPDPSSNRTKAADGGHRLHHLPGSSSGRAYCVDDITGQWMQAPVPEFTISLFLSFRFFAGVDGLMGGL